MSKTNYKKVYCKFFGFAMTNDEFIPSEISARQAVDIHHIEAKQMGGKQTFVRDGITYGIDDIQNLIALTRVEHNGAHSGEITKDELWVIHQRTIESHLRVNKSRMQ